MWMCKRMGVLSVVLLSFFIPLSAQEYSQTSYYVAYDETDSSRYVLVVPSVEKVYTHEAGKITAVDLQRIDMQFTAFPTYTKGELCFSALQKDASGEAGASEMAERCYRVNFFYTQKELVSEGMAFMLYYVPLQKVYEGVAGDAGSFKVVKEASHIYNDNSVTGDDYTHFVFDINSSTIKGLHGNTGSDSDEDGLADRYEKALGLVVGKKDADNPALDPLFARQWYLENVGYAPSVATNILQEHEDINATPVWKETLGSPNIAVSVVDTGIESTHVDLHVDLNRSWCYGTKKHDPSVTNAQLYEDKEGSAHGTACAGIIAAKSWNHVGVRGIAPQVTLAGLNVFSDPTDASFADALQRMNIDVSSNSWGGGGAYWLYDDATSLEAIENGIVNGRRGKGIVYIFASGNDAANANFQSILTSGYVVAVSAVDGAGKLAEYSEFGANILVTAPGGAKDGDQKPAIVTTDLSGLTNGMDRSRQHWDVPGNEEGNYTHLMNGTSAACPMVAGVAALILSENTALSYRDVQYILATTAAKVDTTDLSWKRNASGYAISDKYGYGRINAYAAVQKAKHFVSLGAEVNMTKSTEKSFTIQSGEAITIPFQVADAFRMMVAQVTVWIEHENRGKLTIELESPGGTRSVLAYGDTVLYDAYDPWRFASVQMIDEKSDGVWKVHIRDNSVDENGTVKKCTLVLKGYKR